MKLSTRYLKRQKECTEVSQRQHLREQPPRLGHVWEEVGIITTEKLGSQTLRRRHCSAELGFLRALWGPGIF